MPLMIIFVSVIVVGIYLAIRERRPIPTMPAPLWKANYPDPKYGREQAENIIEAAALCEQRNSGRHLGGDVHVFLNTASIGTSTDFEVRNHAKWIDLHGASNGVYIHYMDGFRELSPSEKEKWEAMNEV